MSETDQQRFFVEKLLSSCFKGLKVETIHAEFPDTKGDGYLSSIVFATVNHKNTVLNLVIKLAHQNEEKRSFIEPTRIFEREAYFYTKFYPAITAYQNENLISSPFSSVTTCYGVYLKDNTEALVFKDIRPLGYKLWDRRTPMDANHVAIVLEEYGKLHAASLAMRNRDPKRFSDITDCLEGSDMFAEIARTTNSIPTYEDILQYDVELLESKGYKEIARRMGDFKEQIPDVLLKFSDETDVYSVVLHGDCWCNNMMFVYKEGDPKPSKMCFLDFQLSRLGSPLLDFSYFFYACASKDVLDEVDKYLQIYYDSLCKCLKEYGCDPEIVFPRSVFEEHWRKYSKFGLLISLVLFRIALCDKDEAPDTTEDFGKDLLKPLKNEGMVSERVINVAKHFVDNNLI